MPAKRRRPEHRRALPGDPTGDRLVDRIVRVDHAGEYGAKRIYDGQLAVLGDNAEGETIRAMAEAEAEHLEWFDKELVSRGVRPTALHPFWHVAGYALGAATAMMGPKAAMACTVAVEEAIDEHYAAQEAALGKTEPKLKRAIERFHADELHHRDTALEHDAEKAPGYRAMKHAIKNGVRAAIWLSERV
ncbi:MAG TPA: demethoxyubiquinone hydroxylase family protein [Alphaproteobacteria bacterium]|nr:demethoxyubiquinone hydroxylase family protein [Alphaproteobacteria bacterium]